MWRASAPSRGVPRIAASSAYFLAGFFAGFFAAGFALGDGAAGLQARFVVAVLAAGFLAAGFFVAISYGSFCRASVLKSRPVPRNAPTRKAALMSDGRQMPSSDSNAECT